MKTNEEKAVDGQIHLKIKQELINEFKGKCELIGRPHTVILREMIEAMVQGRLTINPNQYQKDLYND